VSDIPQHSPLVTQGEVGIGVYNWADIIEAHVPRQAIEDEPYPCGGRRITGSFMFIPEGGQDSARYRQSRRDCATRDGISVEQSARKGRGAHRICCASESSLWQRSQNGECRGLGAVSRPRALARESPDPGATRRLRSLSNTAASFFAGERDDRSPTERHEAVRTIPSPRRRPPAESGAR
jgi:hypothetical protein